MIELYILLFVIFWIICSVLEFGFIFAYWQKDYPSLGLAKYHYNEDKRFALICSIFGPISLCTTLFNGYYKYGLKFK